LGRSTAFDLWLEIGRTRDAEMQARFTLYFHLDFCSLLRNNIVFMKKPAPKKPRRSPGPRPKVEPRMILSFTIPPELEEPMNQAAAARGMSRSAYIVWLVRRDLAEEAKPSRIKRKG
jgi:hypothetical protein